MRHAIALLLLLSAGTAGATSLDEVYARYLEARGGLANLRALQSVRLTGKIVLTRGNSKREMQWGRLIARPGKVRDETTVQGLTQVSAYDGKEAWSYSPFFGRREANLAPEEQARSLARNADLEGPFVGFKAKGHRAEYLGTEDVDGTPAHKIRLTLADGDVKYLYLDPDAFLEIRVVDVQHVRGAEQFSETDYGSYGQLAGVWFPFARAGGPRGGSKSFRVIVDKAEANVPVDDSLFRFPAAGAQVTRSLVAAKGAPDASWKGPALGSAKPVVDSGVISGIGARNIGSAAMSGRISALDARNLGGKTTLFVGAASGGVWKSTDNGTTFRPVFDEQPVQSIGAVAIDPSNPNVVWVGTGESWTRNTVSIGDGLYKSTDGGETWANVGLRESERIARIVVSPKSPDVVYVCVPGKLWSDSAERGVYRTTDGGKTWALVLKGANLSTGCSGLAMDPEDPNVLFAGLWDFRRTAWSFRSGGDGPDAKSGSGLYRTADGGKSWREVTAGLPAKPWGRVEVAVAPSSPKVVYATVEAKDGGLFRSSDGGATWEARDKSQWVVWRPFYFARLVVDPTHPDRLFKTNARLVVSVDGGRSFSGSGGRAHGDWHDLWIDPQNPNHVIGGDDGGLWLSYDGGSRWWKGNNLPVSQYYHVSLDDQDPYNVYGGLQDNSTWVGPSARGGGITPQTWENLYDSDGFWAFVDPTDPQAVYAEAQGGYIGRVDRRTQTTRDIQPKAGYREKLRFNWNTPIALSPADKRTLYIGAQFLFRSRDRGDTWERISPDLTTNDPRRQQQEESGGVTVDNSSAETSTTIYSISESPKDARVIWVGTDDGNVQLTRDGGKRWINVAGNVKGLPKGSWVSWVEASRFDAGTAYAAFDRHWSGDMTPWVYRTADFGKTWARIASPAQGVRGYAHVIKEDVASRSLLFLGTELGLWISVDGGKSWAEFKGGHFPSVAVRDLQIHPRDQDLVIATHGRGIWIADDLSPLRALSSELLARDAAFVPGRPVQQRLQPKGGWADGDAVFTGENPPAGAVITYYQRARHLFGPIALEILDDKGAVVDTLPASNRRGLNRVVWSMQVKAPRVPRAAQVSYSGQAGPRVMPGTYTVRLKKGDSSIETKLEIGLDRRAPFTLADRKAQLDAAMGAHALFGTMSALVDRIDAAQRSAKARLDALPAKDALAERLRSLLGKLDATKKKVVATKEGGAITGEERLREHLDILYSALLSWEGRPAAYQLERLETLRRELSDVQKEFDALAAREVRPLDEPLKQRKLEPIATEAEAL